MGQIAQLISIAESFALKAEISLSAVSSRVFNDGKKIASLKNGGDITVTRWHNAIVWFSENWPDEADWPKDIDRPSSRLLSDVTGEQIESVSPPQDLESQK